VLTLFNYPITNYWETHDNQIKNIKTTKHTLIYTGDISEVRGLWSMLAVVEELIKVFFDVRLLLIGEITSSELKEKIDHYIKSRNLEDAVVFLGHIPHQDVASYMKLASIGLLLYEPLKKFLKNIPTKQYEYAASGLALVASDLPPTRNFILPNKCGILVTPGNVAEAVDAITYLFKHTIELEMLGNNGKKIILDKYNWHNQESELLNIYKTMTH
jgi:glycosyltransferase involved in cell wall biosynthesis